jgi:hypothetical protein
MAREGSQYPPGVQGRVFYAMCVLHNFIRSTDPSDLADDDPQFAEDSDKFDEGDGATLPTPSLGGLQGRRATEEAARRRDDIAQEMWERYCNKHGIENNY